MSTTNIIDLYIGRIEQQNEYYAFYVNQGDSQSRTIQANLYINLEKNKTGTIYGLSDETITVIYEYININGEIVDTAEFECTKLTSVGSNVISFVIPNTVLITSGKVKTQIRIYKNENTLLNSTLFNFCVIESLTVGTATS